MLDELVPKAATVAILGIPAMAHAVLAEIPGATPEWMGSITQVSAFGLVAWIVYYMFTRWLPDIQAAHAAEMTLQREAHAEAIRLLADASAKATAAMALAFSDSLKTQRADLLALIPSK